MRAGSWLFKKPVAGGGGGETSPDAPNNSIQFNGAGSFQGEPTLLTDGTFVVLGDGSANGNFSMSVGTGCEANEDNSYAGGELSVAGGLSSHAHGTYAMAFGLSSHAEGYQSKAFGNESHAEGASTNTGGEIQESLTMTGTGGFASGDITSNFPPGDYVIYLMTGGTGPTSMLVTVLTSAYDSEGVVTNLTWAESGNDHTNGTIVNPEVAIGAHSEGDSSQAFGDASHAEGGGTTASGYASHSEGESSTASGDASHAEGTSTLAAGLHAHAEGFNTKANGNKSHAEGNYSIADGTSSHAEGEGTVASGYAAHAAGSYSKAAGNYSHARGIGTKSNGSGSSSCGKYTQAHGNYSHAEGLSSRTGVSSVAITILTPTTGTASGNKTAQFPNGTYLMFDMSGGSGITAQTITITNISYNGGSGLTSITWSESVGHSAGYLIDPVVGIGSHAEGTLTKSEGSYSHAEGKETVAEGNYSHAEGVSTHANGEPSHAEGQSSVAAGNASHAEGFACTANGGAAHAEGGNTTANGDYSHAEGRYTETTGAYSHAMGKYSIARLPTQFAQASAAFVAYGDAQFTRVTVVGVTSNNTPTALSISNLGIYVTVPGIDSVMSCLVRVVAAEVGGGDTAEFTRKCLIADVGGTTALVGSVQTIGTDIGSNAGATPAGWAATLIVDAGESALVVQVTGATATNIRWLASVELLELTGAEDDE